MAEAADDRAGVVTEGRNTVPECGIVMPISEIDGCPASHWAEVLGIMTDALTSAGFRTQIVSNNGSSPIIQKRIVQSLYFNDIIICDISGKNANVMLELGMRLAFDKPVIIVKDDKTAYSFDISPLDHLSYPRDLRFGLIVDFKEKLIEKAKTLLDESSRPGYSGSYLKSFGDFKVAQIDKTEVSGEALVLDEIKNLRALIETGLPGRMGTPTAIIYKTLRAETNSLGIEDSKRLRELVGRLPTIIAASFDVMSNGRGVLDVGVSPESKLTSEKIAQLVDIFINLRSKDSESLYRVMLNALYIDGTQGREPTI